MYSTPQHALDLAGSFTVAGGVVTRLKGTITKIAVPACVVGNKVTDSAKLPILHLVAFDEWEVAVHDAKASTYLPLNTTFDVEGHRRTGTISLDFPLPGSPGLGDITYTAAGGLGCHLTFSITPG
jgi:hypothetical protein